MVKRYEWQKKFAISNLGKRAKRLKIYPNKVKEFEKAYLLGVYIGDGNSHTGFDLTVIDFDFAKRVGEILSNICQTTIKPKKYIRERKDRTEKGYRVRITRTNLKEWLEDITNHKTIIPYFKQNKSKFWFFSGFFDSEGTIKYGGNKGEFYKKNSMYLSLCQKDIGILSKLNNLLTELMIGSSLIKVKNYNSYSKNKFKYILNIYNKNNFKLILDNGHIQIKRKRDKIKEYVNRNYRFTKTHKTNISLAKVGK